MSTASLPSRRNVTVDGSAKDRHGEQRRAAAGDESPQRGDVEGDVERKPKRIERSEAGALELVEAPLENDVRSRTFDLHANARSSGCCKHHGPAIGGNGA